MESSLGKKIINNQKFLDNNYVWGLIDEENGDIIDPITYKFIDDFFILNKRCYNKSTIEKIIEDSLMKNKIPKDPFNRQVIPDTTLLMFPNILQKYSNINKSSQSSFYEELLENIRQIIMYTPF